MGRSKRKRRNYHNRTSDASDASSPLSSSQAFTLSDRQQLLQYLMDYRDGATQMSFSVADTSSNHVTVAATQVPSSQEPLLSSADDSPAPVSITGQPFPALTKEALAAPYLPLPKTLTSKQRRVVHECCVDVDVFHCGVGTAECRWVVISIHSDGFRSVKELSPPHRATALRHCRPWFYRQDSSDKSEGDTQVINGTQKNVPPRHVLEATRKGRESIQRLLDQPGTCLRDEHDILDFQEVATLDLSSVPPVTVGSGDSWVLIDTPEKMKHCVEELNHETPSELGFDLEMYNTSKYYQVTCLIQLSSSTGKDYVIDVLAPDVWEAVPLLAPLFADATVCKIGHGIGGMDVSSLHRDFGIFVVNAFDTYEAAKVLGFKKKGLAALCKHYGLPNGDEYSLLKEHYQNTDWTSRPLTEPMLRYARTDVHYLVELRRLMIRDVARGELWDNAGKDREEEDRIAAKALRETLRSIQQYEGDVDSRTSVEEGMSDSGSGPPGANECISPSDEQSKKSVFCAKELRMNAGLMRVMTQSQMRCLDLWRAKSEPPMKCSELLLTVKRAAAGEVEWTNYHSLLYQDLVSWRNSIAAKEGVLGDAVCSLDLLVTVARKRPSCKTSLRRIQYFLPPLLEECSGADYSTQMLAIVRSSLEESQKGYTEKQRKNRRLLATTCLVVVTAAGLAVVLTLKRR